MTLQQLADAQTLPTGRVRIVGKYRSFNTYGDLPVATRRTRSDWVIKDDVYSAWVVGKSPSGDGWNLTTLSSNEAAQWVEVTGTVEESRGALLVRATDVRLSGPPSANAAVRAVPRPELAGIVPTIQFTSPIEDIEDVAPDGRFLIQFTKPMDQATFAGRVELRYAGRTGAPFSAMRVTYFENRRVLEVDPGVVLLSGQTIELVLSEGILDTDATPLARQPAAQPGVSRVFRWQVLE